MFWHYLLNGVEAMLFLWGFYLVFALGAKNATQLIWGIILLAYTLTAFYYR